MLKHWAHKAKLFSFIGTCLYSVFLCASTCTHMHEFHEKCMNLLSEADSCKSKTANFTVHQPCSPLCLKVEASHQPARPPGGITEASGLFFLEIEMPGYKWWSPGVWLQNQRSRTAAAVTEVSAMIVIRGLRSSFLPTWSFWSAIQMLLVTHILGSCSLALPLTHTRYSHTLA